jgi:hypothetical protein
MTWLTKRLGPCWCGAGHVANEATFARLAATLQAVATGDASTRSLPAEGSTPATWTRPGSACRRPPLPSRPAMPNPKRSCPGRPRPPAGRPSGTPGPWRRRGGRWRGPGGWSGRPGRRWSRPRPWPSASSRRRWWPASTPGSWPTGPRSSRSVPLGRRWRRPRPSSRLRPPSRPPPPRPSGWRPPRTPPPPPTKPTPPPRPPSKTGGATAVAAGRAWPRPAPALLRGPRCRCPSGWGGVRVA